MAIDPPVAVVVGAAIGVVGAVSAQLVAAIFTSRQELRRLNWEKEDANLQRKHDRSSELTDTKIRLYGTFLASSRAVVDELDAFMAPGGPAPESVGDGPAWKRENLQQRIEILLVAPSLKEILERVTTALDDHRRTTNEYLATLRMADAQHSQHHRDVAKSMVGESRRTATETLIECRKVMNEDLVGQS
jgi:hypothetical protein